MRHDPAVAGRYALIAAPADDEDTTALAAILGDPERGEFSVQRAHDGDAIARFLAARVPSDVVLIHADGVPFDPAALAACRSTHMLVLTTKRLEPGPGRAILSGADPRAVVRALRDGRADRDADGDVTAEELYARLRPTHMVELRSELVTPFVVSRTQRHRPRTPAAGRWQRARQAVIAAGAAGLLVSLPLPWVFGESGLDYAFGEGTAWPSRIAAFSPLVLAVAALAHARTGRWPGVLVALVTTTWGAVLGMLTRWDEPEVGAGIILAFVAPLLILAGTIETVLERRFSLWLASVGGFLAAVALTGSGSWYLVGLGCAMVALGAWLGSQR